MRLPRIGWVVIAAAAAPIVIKAAKPLARKVGEALERGGRKLKEQVDKLAEAEAPADDVDRVEEEGVEASSRETPDSTADTMNVEPESEVAAPSDEPVVKAKRTRQTKPAAASEPKKARATKGAGGKRARQAKPQDNVG
jgi:hypothetical protein